jgi:hypothetical protein
VGQIWVQSGSTKRLQRVPCRPRRQQEVSMNTDSR